jgi:hypothetical protein
MQVKRSLVLACILATTSGAAVAQAPPAPATPPPQTAPPAPPPTTNCTPTKTTPNGNVAPEETTGQAPLGDKLARSDGVLCPPSGVDPEIRAPTPDTGKMPVIPPPGSPGGDPTVRPK